MGLKQIYKTRKHSKIYNDALSNDTQNKTLNSLTNIQSLFFAIKIKKEIYQGKPCFAIFMRDVTKKITAKVLEKQR